MTSCRDGEIWGFESSAPLVNGGGDGGVILGVDGGTTSTVCVCMPSVLPLSDDEPLPVLSRAVAGCSNHKSEGRFDGRFRFSSLHVASLGCSIFLLQLQLEEAVAKETLEKVMAQALSKACSNRSAVRAVCLAVSGVNHPSDQQRIRDWLRGYGIAARALTAVVRAHDGRGPPTLLTENILNATGLSSPDEVIGWTYADSSWARIAALVPVVVSSAEAGDEVADKILSDSVLELAASVKAVTQRLRLCGEDGKGTFPLVMVGGVLGANQRWDIGTEVINCVSKVYPGAYPVRPKVEPAVGAALVALNALNHSIKDTIL